MCACATAKRRRKQSRMVNGRKPPKFDWKLARNKLKGK